MAILPRRSQPVHPHSRGENKLPSTDKLAPVGSSPLARGKFKRVDDSAVERRFIPTRAGKIG